MALRAGKGCNMGVYNKLFDPVKLKIISCPDKYSITSVSWLSIVLLISLYQYLV